MEDKFDQLLNELVKEHRRTASPDKTKDAKNNTAREIIVRYDVANPQKPEIVRKDSIKEDDIALMSAAGIAVGEHAGIDGEPIGKHIISRTTEYLMDVLMKLTLKGIFGND